MSPEAKTILNEWSPPIAIDLTLFLTTLFYLRGWLALRRSCSGVISAPRLAAFLAGMFFLWIAIGSPLTAFDEASLTAHMIQHILLVRIPLASLVHPPLSFFRYVPRKRVGGLSRLL
jgi:putative membrane protein